MALVSILLAVVAFVCTLIGFLTTPIPVLGLVFSFGAAAIALGGIMLGGRAISAAKALAAPQDAARIAVVLNVVAFIPALLVALTCGVCNALFSSGHLQTRRTFDINSGPIPMTAFVDGGAPAAPQMLDAGTSPPTPPGALPPPPLPAGPGK